ncbi:F5/8 type C domain containing protein [Tritrichomonas foetus]|uniref:F5/8 type C domain containing protein n=1 Tax=Tritrichomonas foetus TaxID=1144522 RepID=A0A1J4K956_9EUKA|nr:F5/8 type C domain containing protein [Tritrichomonas foetus]|eukprot:OHT06244.1 F5/8 type C domain containing protein [Tritrichomonas foetus]
MFDLDPLERPFKDFHIPNISKMEYKNLCVGPNGAKLHEFSSQYHHESRACNILLRDPTFVWFSSYYESLPQHITIEFNGTYKIRRLGVYLHGENSQNPKVIEFSLGVTPDSFRVVKTVELEHRAGEHIFDLDEPVEARFIKTRVLENFGGSGIYISKILAFPTAQ